MPGGGPARGAWAIWDAKPSRLWCGLKGVGQSPNPFTHCHKEFEVGGGEEGGSDIFPLICKEFAGGWEGGVYSMGKRMVWGCPCARGVGFAAFRGVPRVPLGSIIPPPSRPIPSPQFFQHVGHPGGWPNPGGGLGGWGGAGPLGVRDYSRRALGPAGRAPSAHGRPLPSIGPCLAQLLQNKNDVVNTTCQPANHPNTCQPILYSYLCCW